MASNKSNYHTAAVPIVRFAYTLNFIGAAAYLLYELRELDESILFELVDRIEVGETKKVGGQRVCDLRVYYRYVGNVDAALAQEERRQPLEEAI